jgi:DNA-binding MarR family transcriptional regulator
MDEFAKSFHQADAVYLLDIYAAAEQPIEGVTARVLAERLQAKHHGVVALATRCEKLGLIVRQASKDDRRVVYLTLSAKGDRTLERLARWHRDEHRALQGRLVVQV